MPFISVPAVPRVAFDCLLAKPSLSRATSSRGVIIHCLDLTLKNQNQFLHPTITKGSNSVELRVVAQLNTLRTRYFRTCSGYAYVFHDLLLTYHREKPSSPPRVFAAANLKRDGGVKVHIPRHVCLTLVRDVYKLLCLPFFLPCHGKDTPRSSITHAHLVIVSCKLVQKNKSMRKEGKDMKTLNFGLFRMAPRPDKRCEPHQRLSPFHNDDKFPILIHYPTMRTFLVTRRCAVAGLFSSSSFNPAPCASMPF
jgi:hypothetical protein